MIVSCGHLAYDTLVRVKHFPERNSACKVDGFGCYFGGGGASLAQAVAKLGGKVELFSAVGDDFAGSDYESDLKKNGVGISEVHITEEPTSRCWMVFDSKDDYECLFHWGASSFLKFLKIPEKFLKGDVMFMALDPQFVSSNIERIKGKVGFDPSYDIYLYTKEDFMEILPKVDYLFLNKNEYPVLSRVSGLTQQKILKNVEAMIISAGEAGCTVYHGKKRTRVPALQVDVVDTVGAGDADRAGFLFGMEKGYSLEESAKIGNIVASFVIQSWGAQTNQPSWEQVKTLL